MATKKKYNATYDPKTNSWNFDSRDYTLIDDTPIGGVKTIKKAPIRSNNDEATLISDRPARSKTPATNDWWLSYEGNSGGDVYKDTVGAYLDAQTRRTPSDTVPEVNRNVVSANVNNAGRPEYAPKYQDYIDSVLGEVQSYGDYVSPYADRIENALRGVEDYGPYSSPYADRIDAQLAAIEGRGPFSYDYTQDPAWQAYKKEYTREGRRATEDTLGQYAAMTGGMPSTAAMTAAQQAGDYYNARMTDKIPELYKLAYDMYLNEGSQMRQNLDMLRGLDSDAYGRYSDTYNRNRALLNDLQGLDATQYGRWSDTYNRMLTNLDATRALESDNYGRFRDTVGDWERDRAFNYQAAQDALDREYQDRAYADSRADAEWEKAYKERAYGDSRSDTDWEKSYKERAYDDNRADTEYERRMQEAAAAASLGDYSKYIEMGINPDAAALLNMTLAGSGRTTPVGSGGYGGGGGTISDDEDIEENAKTGGMTPAALRAGMQNIIRNGGNSDQSYEDAAAYAYAYAVNGMIDPEIAKEIVAEILGNA